MAGGGGTDADTGKHRHREHHDDRATTATAAEVLGAEGLLMASSSPTNRARSNRASAGSPDLIFPRGGAPVGRMGLVRVKDSRSAGAAEAAAWGGRNESHCAPLSPDPRSSMLRKQWVGECTPTARLICRSPRFLESDHGSPRIDSSRLETPHFGRRDAERS